MAGSLPGDPSLHGMVESELYGFSQDKLEEGGRWYLSRKEIEENSPSRRDSIDLKKETYLRKSYCTFLQDLGMRLKVPQVTIATAIIFCHRFFLRQSHMKNDRRTIATVCMFLAGKVEETPRPLKDVILVSYEIIHKKDPAAVQRIKQKQEVYEQQKELILLGERVVLATLGFDLNVNHPYKPLVEAIKKFKVAQNALAQVAWNFVNDGLRTSLCLQFKPHHIAAGAIFLAAKFLKVKLPSDGEKVWWQEFDVTPRQLEEVSNQMLELYEQNRLPASQGSEIDGSAAGGASLRATSKTSVSNEESVLANGYAQSEGMPTVKPGVSLTSGTRPSSDQVYADNGSHKNTQNRSYDYGSTEIRNSNPELKPDDESERQRPEQDPVAHHRENEGETSNRSRFGSERFREEDQEKGIGKNEIKEAGEWKNENSSYKTSNTLRQSPQDAIKKLDKDKVKAALEKRRKSRGDVAQKTDLMDEDDLIERELENGIELAAENEKNKQERKQSWTNTSSRADVEFPNYGKDKSDLGGDGNYAGSRGKSAWEPDSENAEEGEMPLSDDAGQGPRSPILSNRKRKVVSPEKHQLEGKQRHDYTAGLQNHHDIEGSNLLGRHGYAERGHKRHRQENHV